MKLIYAIIPVTAKTVVVHLKGTPGSQRSPHNRRILQEWPVFRTTFKCATVDYWTEA